MRVLNENFAEAEISEAAREGIRLHRHMERTLTFGAMYGADPRRLREMMVEMKMEPLVDTELADRQLRDYGAATSEMRTVPFAQLVAQQNAALQIMMDDPNGPWDAYGIPTDLCAPLHGAPGDRKVNMNRRARDRKKAKMAAKSRKRNRSLK